MDVSQRHGWALLLSAACTVHLGCAESEPPPQRVAQPSSVVTAGAPALPATPAAPSDTAPATLIVPTTPSSSASKPSGTEVCRPGVFVGSYEAELFGGGPLRFDLVASDVPPSAATPCEEFCPELVVNSEGGEFSVAWSIFEGVGKVRGGLDCRSGEFRGELVEGKTGIGPLDAGTAALLPPGKISGSFHGQFSATPKPAISGTFKTLAEDAIEAQGTFRVELQ